MYCKKCGSENEDRAKFCKSCGADLAGNAGGAGNAAAGVPPVQPAKKGRNPLPIICAAVIAVAAVGAALYTMVLVPMQSRKKAYEVTNTFMKALEAGDMEAAMDCMSEDLKKKRADDFGEINSSMEEMLKPLEDSGVSKTHPKDYKEIEAEAEDLKKTFISALVREYSLKESDFKADGKKAEAAVNVKSVSEIDFDEFLDDEMMDEVMEEYINRNMGKLMAYAFAEDDAGLETELLKDIYPPLLRAVKSAVQEAPSDEETWSFRAEKVDDSWKITDFNRETVKKAESGPGEA